MAVDCIEETLDLSRGGEKLHLYRWLDTGAILNAPCENPSFIFIAIHGLMMHGKTFDSLARALVERGGMVVAPDIRGFGKYYFNKGNEPREVDYKGTLDDLVWLLEKLSATFSETPIFCLGESLGAHMARRLAGMHPDMVRGLILSSPCIRPRMVSVPLLPHTLKEMLSVGLNPRKELDLAPFARRFLGKEKERLESYLADPMSRKSLEASELLKSVLIVSACNLMSISPKVPVLVLKGKHDCVCKEKSTEKFLESMRTREISICELPDCGHLILEGGPGEDLNPGALKAIEDWLAELQLL